MHRKSTIISFGTCCFLSMLPACSISDNDVGSLRHDGSSIDEGSGNDATIPPLSCTYKGKTYAIGETFKDDCNTCSCGALGDTVVRCTVMACLGTGGSPGGTGGATASGGAPGTGGISGDDGGSIDEGSGNDAVPPLSCTYKGKTYAIGETFKDDCNTCSCGALGDTVVRCTVMACLGTGGSPGGTGGATASGGAPGTGGATQPPDADGLDASEPPYCAPCVDEAAAKVVACPAERPTTETALKTHCEAYLRAGQSKVTLRVGGCSVPSPLPGCGATSPDATVDVLSVDFSPPSGLECHYARATGVLVGQVAVADSPRYCGGRAYVAATAGVTNPWCGAGGEDVVSISCGDLGRDSGADGASSDGGGQ